MSPSSIAITIIIIVFLIWALFRLQRSAINPPKLRVAMEIIADVDDDFKIIAKKRADPNSLKKFKNAHWRIYRNHVEFLGPEAVEGLQAAFKQIEEYNLSIDATLKNSTPPPVVDLEALVASLTRGRLGLAVWVRDNITRESTRGFFGFR